MGSRLGIENDGRTTVESISSGNEKVLDDVTLSLNFASI